MYKNDPYLGKPDSAKFRRYNFLGRRSKPNPGHYSYMFAQDIHQGIMPFSGRTSNPDFSVELEGEGIEIAKDLIINSIDTTHGKPTELSEAICDFMDEASQSIGWTGISINEISFIYSDESKQEIVGFKFHYLHKDNIHRFLNIFWQLAPRGFEQKRKFAIAHRGNFLVVYPPKAFGGRSNFKRFLKRLFWMGQEPVPKFVLDEGFNINYFDHSIYTKAEKLELARQSKNISWNARGLMEDSTLEFYSLFRSLRFEKRRAKLREQIICDLNRTLAQVGKKLNFSVKIILRGVPTPEDYDEYINRLIDGDLAFEEVVKAIYDWNK